ncbi:DoxX family protein [Nocardia lasii]|uniref:DoxX family protein n=1 Tax=Nocardia lasii TaxID=1616107 RepID=A0ABW1JVA9_9NOCA
MEGLHEHVPDFVISVFLLLVRVIIAASFFTSSRNKFKNMPKFATDNGVPLPLAYFLATAELLGAVGVILGVLTPLPALGLMLLMICTMSMHILKWHSPYWAASGGWEYDLMLFTLAGVLVLFGAGQISVDQLL